MACRGWRLGWGGRWWRCRCFEGWVMAMVGGLLCISVDWFLDGWSVTLRVRYLLDISLKLFLFLRQFGCCELFNSRLVGIYRKGEWQGKICGMPASACMRSLHRYETYQKKRRENKKIQLADHPRNQHRHMRRATSDPPYPHNSPLSIIVAFILSSALPVILASLSASSFLPASLCFSNLSMPKLML